MCVQYDQFGKSRQSVVNAQVSCRVLILIYIAELVTFYIALLLISKHGQTRQRVSDVIINLRVRIVP